MRSVVALAAVTAFLSAPMAPARAQVETREGIALQNQVYQLRQELKAVEDQMARGGSASRPSPYPAQPPQQQYGGNELVTQLLTRVDALEDQVRQLRGRIDETQFQLRRQNEDLSKQIDDLAFQVNPQSGTSASASSSRSQPPGALGPAALGPAALGPAASPSPPRTNSPPGPRTPEIVLQDGNAALARRDYPGAETAAREVLANRTSPRAYDAQFLLAQALSGERQYPQAAVAYDDVYNRARSGSHAQDARLGLASSLTAINEKKAACDVLGRMRNDFPQLRSDISTGMAATAQKAGCH